MPNIKHDWWPEVRDALYRYPQTGDADIARAMEKLSRTRRGQQANALLTLVYFKQRNTFDGAAALCGLTESTAGRRRRMAFFAIAREKGFLEK